jgi:hypothetical protein
MRKAATHYLAIFNNAVWFDSVPPRRAPKILLQYYEPLGGLFQQPDIAGSLVHEQYKIYTCRAPRTVATIPKNIAIETAITPAQYMNRGDFLLSDHFPIVVIGVGFSASFHNK